MLWRRTQRRLYAIMAYKPLIAVYDACVLYPFHVRNLLVQCGVDRLVNARWTDAIHEEWIRNLAANTQNLSVERLTETRNLMKRVLPAADVTDYEKHIPQLTLPDPGDRHVLAAAIAGRASHIVTWDLADFPAEILTPHHVSAQNWDDFLMDLCAAAPDVTITAAENAKESQKDRADCDGIYRHARAEKLTRFLLFCAIATESSEITTPIIVLWNHRKEFHRLILRRPLSVNSRPTRPQQLQLPRTSATGLNQF